jgi:alkanesulfonate monooxygenase SsuD/methylene tetrahydromethanopterin reductase-like flavin-dependent oxidoreductase (luciferase family)
MEIALQTQGPYHELVAVARMAETLGLPALALPDHYLESEENPQGPAWDNLIVLGGLARDTTTIELASLVSPITFRHPAVYAKTATTMAELSGGRFALGLGAGWMEAEHHLYGLPFPPAEERFDRLDESLAYIRAYLSGEGFAGRYYSLEKFDRSPTQRVPLIVGGTGSRRTPGLAGRYADDFNAFPSDSGDLKERIERCREAAAAAGRDPSAIRMSTAFPAVAGLDDDTYRKCLDSMAPVFRRVPEQVEDRLRARHIPHGTPPQIAEEMGFLAEEGIERVYLQLFRRPPAAVEEIVAAFLA